MTTSTRPAAAQPKTARWRCLLRPCLLRGAWQPAAHREAALAAGRRHYLLTHWERP
ncbi:hypothetical protein [Streptosporangium sandarakinum]|uniref:Uncharacterized protein n=1 Tax=Streptosporangium sandarakinum TaxID=1260955 RepID=A0A852V901_9ACTN|nr:hypothetical protein [Streptosporangium sandarakinum]NYF44606.1 hypothetical protein [Streptosporangium sandarakinum]